MDKKTRIGFVGVGGMGQAAHLRNYASTAGVPRSLRWPKFGPHLGAAVARRWNVPGVYT